MTNFERANETFDSMVAKRGPDMDPRILLGLTRIIMEADDRKQSLAHRSDDICQGIRHGLFGRGASPDSSIMNVLLAVCDQWKE